MPAEYVAHLWSCARSAAVDAGRDPDVLRRDTRINVEAGQSLHSLRSTVDTLAADGVDGAFFDLHYSTGSVDEAIDVASELAELLEIGPVGSPVAQEGRRHRRGCEDQPTIGEQFA